MNSRFLNHKERQFIYDWLYKGYDRNTASWKNKGDMIRFYYVSI